MFGPQSLAVGTAGARAGGAAVAAGELSEHAGELAFAPGTRPGLVLATAATTISSQSIHLLQGV